MTLPDEIRDEIRDRIWAIADRLGWSQLNDTERSRYYTAWTKDAQIGVRLGHFMDPRRVRVYIKDSLLKPYERTRLADSGHKAMRLLGVAANEAFVESYIKPHGRRLADGRIVCWGKSRDWKSILMTIFERTRRIARARAAGVVLIETGKTTTESDRILIRDAARRLGVDRLEWID